MSTNSILRARPSTAHQNIPASADSIGSDATLRNRPVAGMTVSDVARRLRVGEDKIRAWIRRGELAAINTASSLCVRPQLRITPEALAVFERRRTAGPPPKPQRRRRQSATKDYYPD
jgi:excisionase family DNA binding protein